jgi:tRNA-Thr(GGU) m(6)t(6)A37 methyltransferase TsaA
LPKKKIEIKPIGFVKRASSNETVKDKSLVSKIVLKKDFIKALDGIEEFSHIFIIFWMHKISEAERATLQVHPQRKTELPLTGVFATRTPIRPNPIGLTLVKLTKRKGNVLWVKGLDAYDGTPILDIKPYPDWEKGHLVVVTDFKAPEWLFNSLNRCLKKN